MATTETQTIRAQIQSAPEIHMPGGSAEFTLAVRVRREAQEALDVEVSVQAAYVRLSRRGAVEQSVSLDDGRIVIDLDARGRVLGVEMTALKTPDDLPEYKRYVQERLAGDPTDPSPVLAPATLARLWEELEHSVGVAVDVAKRFVAVAGAELSEEQVRRAVEVPQQVLGRGRSAGKLAWERRSTGDWSRALASA